MRRKKTGQGVKPGKLDEDATLDRDAIILTAVVLALSSVATALGHFLTPGNLRQDISLSVLLTALTYVVTLQRNSLVRFTRIDKRIEELSNRQEGFVPFNASSHKIIQRALSIMKLDEILQHTGFFALDRAFEGVSLADDDREITITGRELAFQSYVAFWKKILDLQIRSGGLVAFATHVTEIGPWDGRTSRVLNAAEEIHHDFVAKGGKLFRVFVDRGNTGHIKNYVAAISAMREDGVECAYVHQKHAHHITDVDLGYDFCIISPLHYTSRWNLKPGGFQVEGCSIGLSETDFEDYFSRWAKFARAAKNYDTSVHKRYSLQALSVLEEAQASFKSALAKIEGNEPASSQKPARPSVSPEGVAP